jgi:hypothetical protein
VNYPDAEVEPYIAVDPTNPTHLITTVQQDRWFDGGSNGLTDAVSTNGGKTWALATTQPPVSICNGATPGSPGYFQRATDPWVSFSSDGKTAYSISDSFNANGPNFGGASSIVISRSTDGGVNWQTPVTARLDTSFNVLNDKESVTADATKPLNAYAVWDRLVSPSTNANPGAFPHTPAFRGPALFSRTTDGGVTWSPGRVIFDPGEQNQTIGNQILVPKTGAAAGQLIDGFNLLLNKGGKGHNFRFSHSPSIIRSADDGNTWSGAIVIAQEQPAPVFINGELLRTADDLPEFAAGPEGNLYAVWQDGRFSPTGNAKVAFSMSTNGGLNWSTPIRIDQSKGAAPAFEPMVTVRSDGTVAVSYYDLENSSNLMPDVTAAYMVTCSSKCTDPASWATGGETQMGPTFNILTAPKTVSGDGFLGDYQGLAASGDTVNDAFVMANPVATFGPTDLFFNTLP